MVGNGSLRPLGLCLSGQVLGSDRFIWTRELLDGVVGIHGRLPAEVSGVCGIARSGLLPASMLAVLRHLPLFSVGCCSVLALGGGGRLSGVKLEAGPVAVIDDTVSSGWSMHSVEPLVKWWFPGREILRVAVFVRPQAAAEVDFYWAGLGGPHFLEWNFFNSGVGEGSATDFDGILCEEISAVDDDDGPGYVRALEFARPLQLPRFRGVAGIVTGRLERYRGVTEGWLRRWGVRFGWLEMGPWGSAIERGGASEVAQWKAGVLARRGPVRYVESDELQAAVIAASWPREVICPAAGRVWNYTGFAGDVLAGGPRRAVGWPFGPD